MRVRAIEFVLVIFSFLIYYDIILAGDFIKEYYPNGQLRREYQIADGKRDGICRNYTEDGVLARDETWKDGKLDGVTKAYGKNGSVIAEALWADGVLKNIQNTDMTSAGWIPGPAPEPSIMVFWCLAAGICVIALLYFLIVRSEH